MRHRRLRRIVLICAAVVALFLVAACGPPAPAAQNMIDRHNFARTQRSLAPLNVDVAAQIRAQMHADRVAAGFPGSCSSGQLWHSGELGSWYAGMRAGENAACVTGCPADGAAAFDMWLNSPGHAANVFSPDYRWIGVATACTGTVQIVIAQYHS
jgi:uncharacterized protein YkwD